MTSLNSRVDLYLDPFINPINKLIINKIDQIASRDGFKIVRDLEDLSQNSIPKIIIFEADNNERLKALIDNSNNIAIQIDQPNLDLFSSQGLLDNTYLIKNEDDFLKAYELALFHLDSFLRRKSAELLSQSHLELKKAISKKNIFNIKNLTAQIVKRLITFEEKLYLTQSIEDINIELERLHKDFTLGVMCLKESGDFLFENQKSNFLAIEKNAFETLFFCWERESLNTEIMVIYYLLNNFFQLSHKATICRKELQDKEFMLSRFKFPIAIFDENEEILIHNSYFVDLNMSSKTCLNFKDNDQITIDRIIYRVIVTEKKNKHLEYLFIPANDFLVGQENPTFEEMGIISSSIAHELNNPLAGVSAAIDYLLLDELDKNTEETILEMKKGVLKCRKLVKTFLSFSQVNTVATDGEADIENCFHQALELMRSRLIENNLNFNLDFEKNDAFKININPDIYTMLFYLLLSDFLTNLSHHKLVSRQNNKILSLKIIEKKSSLIIFLPESQIIDKSFFESKLVNHLFELTQLAYLSHDDYIEMKEVKN